MCEPWTTKQARGSKSVPYLCLCLCVCVCTRACVRAYVCEEAHPSPIDDEMRTNMTPCNHPRILHNMMLARLTRSRGVSPSYSPLPSLPPCLLSILLLPPHFIIWVQNCSHSLVCNQAQKPQAGHKQASTIHACYWAVILSIELNKILFFLSPFAQIIYSVHSLLIISFSLICSLRSVTRDAGKRPWIKPSKVIPIE